MVQISNAVVIVTVATAPILAAPIRGGIKGPYGCQRGLVRQYNLEARDPAVPWGTIAKGALGVITTGATALELANAVKDLKKPNAQSQPQAQGKREYDEGLGIYARDPAVPWGTIAKGTLGVVGAGGAALEMMSSIKNLHKPSTPPQAQAPGKREYNDGLEIDARDPAIPWKGIAKGVGYVVDAAGTTAGLASALIPQKSSQTPGKREYDELEARFVAPSSETLKMIAKGVGGAAGIASGIAVGMYNRKQAREFYDELEARDGELEVRDFYDELEDLETREPFATIPPEMGASILKAVTMARKARKHIKPREASYDELD